MAKVDVVEDLEPAAEPAAPTPKGPKAPPVLAEFDPGATAEHDNAMMAAFRRLNAQPKVSVRIAKGLGPQSVIINGARFNIPAGIPVDVPKDVADLLRYAELA